MSSVPSKAKRVVANGHFHTRGPPTRVRLLERLKDDVASLAEHSMFEQATCTVCHQYGDRGTFIALARVDNTSVEDVQLLCSTECFLDYVEKELIDNRVERAIRDERTFLHNVVCPACKRRVRSGIEEGELDPPD